MLSKLDLSEYLTKLPTQLIQDKQIFTFGNTPLKSLLKAYCETLRIKYLKAIELEIAGNKIPIYMVGDTLRCIHNGHEMVLQLLPEKKEAIIFGIKHVFSDLSMFSLDEKTSESTFEIVDDVVKISVESSKKSFESDEEYFVKWQDQFLVSFSSKLASQKKFKSNEHNQRQTKTKPNSLLLMTLLKQLKRKQLIHNSLQSPLMQICCLEK